MRIPGTKNSHEFSGHRKTEFFNSIAYKRTVAELEKSVFDRQCRARTGRQSGSTAPQAQGYKARPYYAATFGKLYGVTRLRRAT
jgi:hypothetical protein